MTSRLRCFAARSLLALLALLPPCQARAQAAPADVPEVVRVMGVRAVPWQSYRAMRAAMDAYETYKYLAPDVVFGFGVILPRGQNIPPNFALRVRTPEGREYPVAMDGKFFTLPILPGDARDGDLVTNLKDVPVKVGFAVDTPGVPQGMDRLGDLRLGCQIKRAFQRVDDGFLARLLRPNFCDTDKGEYWMYPQDQLPSRAAFLVQGARSVALQRKGEGTSTRYLIPLYDTSWSNEALVDYRIEAMPPRRGRPLIYDADD